MHVFTVDCDTYPNEENAAVVIPVTGVEVKETDSEAMLDLNFAALLLAKCLLNRLGSSAQG